MKENIIHRSDVPKGPTLAEKRMKRDEQLQTDLDLLEKNMAYQLSKYRILPIIILMKKE